jgi:predicted nucleic acid-binding protein
LHAPTPRRPARRGRGTTCTPSGSIGTALTAFLDTNVIVYAFDGRDPAKQARALATLEGDPDAAVSTQVLAEVGHALVRKIGVPIDVVRSALDELSQRPLVVVDARLVADALLLHARGQISYWDAMIVQAASRCGATVLLTEDLTDGMLVGEVRIVNPFAAPTR